MRHSFHLIDLVTLAKVSSLFAGNYRTSFQGSGMEFSDIREYVAGDDTSDIDWKTTARTGKVFIKKYEEDRERRVLFLVDTGANMRFGSGDRTKFDTLSELFSILSFSSVENGDPTGTWLYSDQLLVAHPPKKWHPHLARIRDDFDRYRNIDHPKESTLSVPMNELAWRSLKNHLIFIFTDATDPIDESIIRSIGAQNDAILIHIFDSFENALSSDHPIHAIGGGNDLYISPDDTRRRDAYVEHRTRELDTFRKTIVRLGWSYLALDERDNVYGKLYDFFKRRQGR